jgi:hypothetical protein
VTSRTLSVDGKTRGVHGERTAYSVDCAATLSYSKCARPDVHSGPPIRVGRAWSHITSRHPRIARAGGSCTENGSCAYGSRHRTIPWRPRRRELPQRENQVLGGLPRHVDEPAQTASSRSYGQSIPVAAPLSPVLVCRPPRTPTPPRSAGGHRPGRRPNASYNRRSSRGSSRTARARRPRGVPCGA